MAKATEFTMETVEKIGVISDNGKSTLELRKTRVNQGELKWDIRNWYTDDKGIEKCNKGIRLTEDELMKLGEIINSINESDFDA